MTRTPSEADVQRRVLVAVVLVTALLAVLTPSSTPAVDASSARPSSFRSDPAGGRAFFLALEALGFDVGPWQRGFAELELEPQLGTLVVLQPALAPDRDEVDFLLRWIERGGHALYAPRDGDDALLAELGLRLVEHVEPSTLTATEHALQRFGDALPEELLQADGLRSDPDAAGLRFKRAFELIDESDGNRGGAQWIPWLVNERDEAALVERSAAARGRLLLVADVDELANRDVAGASLATALAAILAQGEDAAPGGRWIGFDEAHHGYREGGLAARLGRFLIDDPRGRALALLGAIGLAALISLGVRLGAPLPDPPRPPRSRLEHVDALGTAYRLAGARRRPAHLFVDGLRRRLDTHELSAALERCARREPRLAAAAERIGAVERGTRSVASARELVQLAQDVDAVAGALQPGRLTSLPDRARE